MTCPTCGAPLAQGLRFCKQCWSPIDATTSSSSPSDPSASGSHRTSVDDGLRAAAAANQRDQRGPLFGVGYNDSTEPASGPLHATNIPLPLAVAPQWTGPVQPVDNAKPSSRAIAAMLFGLLSVVFFCGFIFTVPVDLIGLGLAFFELRAIARGQRPIAGRNLAFIGLVITSVVLAIKTFLMLAVFS